MRFIELFAGIGGFRHGLEKAENRNSFKGKIGEGKARLQPNWNDNRNKGDNANIGRGVQQINNGYFQCVYSNEIDKYACQIYQKNFGEGELYEGDIRKITTESIPNHDLLTAGFPCQSFSIAGKRKGFRDTRGTLFFEICRIVEAKKPNLLLLENVKGLLNHDGGNTFRIILNSLSELGYDCEWEVLNSKNFGVPQNRERVFIVGHFRGTSGQKVFPIGKNGKIYNEQKTSSGSYLKSPIRGQGDKPIIEIAGSLTGGGHSGGLHSDMTLLQINKNVSDAQRVFDPNGVAPALKALGGGQGAKTGLYMNTLTEAIGTRQGSSKEFIKSVKNINKAIGQIRRLTPIECERLQGFPDGWTEGISDTQRYKCLGNAVTTNVITEIGKKIILNKKREG